MTPKIYGNGYRIVQAPGYVVLMAEMIHEARVIPLASRPHIGEGIRSYMGDSRGRFRRADRRRRATPNDQHSSML
jgi:hypothetical protein